MLQGWKPRLDEGWSYDATGAAKPPRVRLNALFACRRGIEAWIDLGRLDLIEHFASLDEAWELIEKLECVTKADACPEA